MLLRASVIALLLTAALPAAASARLRAQPLLDIAPAGPAGVVHDRVLTATATTAAAGQPTARAAQAGAIYSAYATTDGMSVAVAMSPRYTTDPAVAQSYVDFLDGLPHGAELARLRVYIAPPDEVVSACGGLDGVLACYSATDHLMIVPGTQGASPSAPEITTSYVVTHEYGHHVAAYRSNAPFPTLDYGPKYWASYERVCDRTLQRELAPGDEAAHYTLNPGENWAETYARLKYPDQPWTFSSLLAPDAGSLAAARRDIVTPWNRGLTRTFTGHFTAGGASLRHFAFPLHLDGRLSIVLGRPAHSAVQATLLSGGKVIARTPRTGASTITLRAACRQVATEQVTVAVRRFAGAGRFTLSAFYAG